MRRADFEFLGSWPSISTHASDRVHLWIFLQAGHCMVSGKFNVSRIMISVVTPVGTFVPNIGHRIKMSGMTWSLFPEAILARQAGP
jgi:hypothetical protein